MTIKLLHYTPLWVASTAIRKCWASEARSDTCEDINYVCPTCNTKGVFIDDTTWQCTNSNCPDYDERYEEGNAEAGPDDKALIERVGNKNKHSSTLEHLNYNFDIDGISRACLQELSRHRHTSLSVKSTRYTLKELKNAPRDGSVDFNNYVVLTDDSTVNSSIMLALDNLKSALESGRSNDITKYCLPEAYKTSLVWTINARSLQNFLSLRSNKAALWEIQELAHALYKELPDEHKYLFEDSLNTYE